MGYSTITQIALVVISIAIMFVYIQPKFGDLKEQQDEIAEYQDTVDKATQFNARLSQLLQQAGAFSQIELEQLEQFLPQSIDAVVVARDINTIAEESGILLGSIEFSEDDGIGQASRATAVGEEEIAPTLQSAAAAALESEQFTITVNGSYEEFKEFLRNLEANAYPLEVVSLTFGAGNSADSDEETSPTDNYEFELTLETYALNVQPN